MFFKAYPNSNDAVNHAVETKVILDAEVIDSNGKFDSTTNYRFSPGVTGHYLICGCVSYLSPPANKAFVAILKKNGTSNLTVVRLHSSLNDVLGVCFTDILRLDSADDYLELWAYHEAGATVSISGAVSSTFLSGCKLDC